MGCTTVWYDDNHRENENIYISTSQSIDTINDQMELPSLKLSACPLKIDPVEKEIPIGNHHF